jgi:NADPH2:quinone reductase
MRAVWYERHGKPHDVLELGSLPIPDAGQGELRVRLEASGVNPADCYRRQGPGAMEFPRVVTHSDGAGVVDRVGAGVAASWLGQRVWLYNGQRNGRWMGTAAEYIALDADLVMPLPDHVTFAEGATLGIPCMTAHVCVFKAGPVQGRTVLVTGGAGAVGHYAVQLASWAGATVIATASSPAKAERARQGGAAHVIDYRTQDVAAAVRALTDGKGVDHIVDVDFGGNLAATLGALRQGGSVAVYATNGDRTPRLPVRELMQRNAALHFVVLPLSAHAARRRAQHDIVA